MSRGSGRRLANLCKDKDTGIRPEIEPAPSARPLSGENRMSSPAGVVWPPRPAGPIRAPRQRNHAASLRTTPAKSLVGWDDYEQKESPERARAFELAR